MLQHRRQAAEQVAQSLFETEAAIDAAIAAAAKLTGLMPSARTDAKLSAVVGQDAFEIASVTLNELIQARRSIVQTHNTLVDVQTQVGLRAVSFGGGIDKPSAEQAGERTLSVVREAAAG